MATKIFFPEQPEVKSVSKPNTTGKGPANWVNTNCLFKKEGSDKVSKGQFQGDYAKFVTDNIGKWVEVVEVKAVSGYDGFKIIMPKREGADGGFKPYQRYDEYKGQVLTPEEYFSLVSTAYHRFLTDVKQSADQIFDAEIGPNGMMETAQQLTLQYVIAVQKNMVKVGEVKPVEPKTEDALAQEIIQKTLKRIQTESAKAGGALPAEAAHQLADAIRNTTKLTPEQKASLTAKIVEAQTAVPATGE